jgi:precorrin-2 dehydrogenase/sirohydrochlorin ferrochelatase
VSSEYPICLNLQGKMCLIAGGGPVAQRKAADLIAAGAAVTVISPELTSQLRDWADAGNLKWYSRQYQQGDVQGFFLVFCATDSAEVNRGIAQEAQIIGVLANVADDPELCSFTVPATMRQGDLTIAVSTNGKSPAVAREVRKELALRYGPEYGEYLALVAALRKEWKKNDPCCANRQARWRGFQGFDTEVLRLLRAGCRKEAEERLKNAFGCSGPES